MPHTYLYSVHTHSQTQLMVLLHLFIAFWMFSLAFFSALFSPTIAQRCAGCRPCVCVRCAFVSVSFIRFQIVCHVWTRVTLHSIRPQCIHDGVMIYAECVNFPLLRLLFIQMKWSGSERDTVDARYANTSRPICMQPCVFAWNITVSTQLIVMLNVCAAQKKQQQKNEIFVCSRCDSVTRRWFCAELSVYDDDKRTPDDLFGTGAYFSRDFVDKFLADDRK